MEECGGGDKEEKMGRDKKKNKIKEERKKKELCWICLNEDLVFFVDIPSIQPISLSLILPIFFSFLFSFVHAQGKKGKRREPTILERGLAHETFLFFFLI